jgi:hypothetical protein
MAWPQLREAFLQCRHSSNSCSSRWAAAGECALEAK